ncbi:dynein regulatory complex protein 1 [Prorops nasuta]|uniref:dynein regulatory complex protein 1 n=1 Tax=Prorops nasuta TaxID=863751 RepID=UPI0034CE63D0
MSLEERKLERRFRVQNHFEESHTKVSADDESTLEESKIKKQLLETSDILNKLLSEGDEVITCVKVANDAREVYRRKKDNESRRNLFMEMEAEDEVCTAMYCDIVKNWPDIMSRKDPLSIHNEIKAQYERCQEVYSRKDYLIAKLRKELENADSRYEEDLKKQADDITHLIERIENQFTIMVNSYRRELMFIDKVIDDEHKALLKTADDKWNELFKQVQVIDRDGLQKRKDIIRDYEAAIEQIIIEHQEESRMERMKLTSEIDNLQQEVENMKAVCLMNVEKLEYSYAVLKCREEENLMIHSHQKRKINDLRTVIKDLKEQYSQLEQNMKGEIKKLVDQIVKSRKSMLDLERKSRHFKRVNQKQYSEIWKMNVENANEMMEKILSVDQMLYKKILCLEWKEPDNYEFLKNAININPVHQEKNRENRGEMLKLKENKFEDKSSLDLGEDNVEKQLLNHVMQLISDETGYLVENDLRKLLRPYTKYENTLIRLDDIFKALNIDSTEQINLILNFFLPHAYCPTCMLMKETEGSPPEYENNVATTSSISEASSAMNKVTEYMQIMCEKNHMLQIQRSKVTKALKEFIQEYSDFGGNKNSSNKQDESVLQNTSLSGDVAKFWQQYRDVFSPTKEQFWDVLLDCLQNYYKILKERHDLANENRSLAKQNAELERLLETYLVKHEDCKSEEVLALTGFGGTG